MSLSKKYGRTYHFPFSPGTTNDDRVNFNWWEDMSDMKKVIHTEKLDGENSCINQYGVFSRSHTAPTAHPWANYLKERWAWMRNDIGDIEIFGENLYAIHSIEYKDLDEHFHVFAVREKDMWLSWEEVEFYADFYGLSTVPVLAEEEPDSEAFVRASVLSLVSEPSTFDSVDVFTEEPCTMEGIVTRNMEAFPVKEMQYNVFKYVREDHVKTDEHWARNWKRAALNWETWNKKS